MQYADDSTIKPEEYRAFGEDDKASIEGAGTFLRNAQVFNIYNNIKKYTYNCAWDFSHQEVPPQLLRNNIFM